MSEYMFLAAAGEEKLASAHSDGVHLFFDMDWDEFRPAMSKPYEWLIDHVQPDRQSRVEKELDLLVVPLDSGFTVDYSEEGRVVTLGIGPYEHRPTTLKEVAERIHSNVLEFGRSAPTIVERRLPSREFISRHVELGDFSIWPDVAPVILQSTNRLFETMLAPRTGGPLFHLDRLDMGVVDGLPELRIDPRQRFTYFIQLNPLCSLPGETEAACLNNYPGWNRVGSGSTKRYCFGPAAE